MNPGITERPSAAITRAASVRARSPRAAIRPSAMPTSQTRAGAPDPSSTAPPRTITSSMSGPVRAPRPLDSGAGAPVDPPQCDQRLGLSLGRLVEGLFLVRPVGPILLVP